MESPDILSCNSHGDSNELPSENSKQADDLAELQEQVIANFQKPNLPNVNVPERIIICLDTCCDEEFLYRLGDGTTFTPVNMLKRALDFFVQSKLAINRGTEFAILILKDTEACWLMNFTNNIKDITSTIDYITVEESTSESFDFNKVYQLLKEKVEIPEYKGDCLVPPPYVVRMVVLYGRSNCIPLIPQDDPYLIFLKKQLYFYIDILLSHKQECNENKCEDVYDALQDMDNGYSYVFEVSRNATKIHDCIAKLLAHPLQRALQKNTDYTFGSRY